MTQQDKTKTNELVTQKSHDKSVTEKLDECVNFSETLDVQELEHRLELVGGGIGYRWEF